MPRWILANVLGGLGALGLTAVAGALSSLLPTEGTLPQLALVGFMVVTGAVEGAIVGAAQAAVLDVPRARWALATALGFAIAWAFGASLSFLEPETVPSAASKLFVALVGGGVLGGVVGALQRRVLPVQGWVVVSSLAWAAAMMVSAIAQDRVPYGPFGGAALAINILGGACSGLVVALVTGSTIDSHLSGPKRPARATANKN